MTLWRRCRREHAICCCNLVQKNLREWTLKQKRLLITDTTFRDAHQSLMATRVRTYDMLACAAPLARRLGASKTGCFHWKCGVAPRSTPRCDFFE